MREIVLCRYPKLYPSSAPIPKSVNIQHVHVLVPDETEASRCVFYALQDAKRNNGSPKIVLLSVPMWHGLGESRRKQIEKDFHVDIVMDGSINGNGVECRVIGSDDDESEVFFTRTVDRF